MSFDRTVKVEDILAGFASMHQAVTEGFDKMERGFVAIEQRFQNVERQILDVRNDVARLETRMLRRFDRLEIRVALIAERSA